MSAADPAQGEPAVEVPFDNRLHRRNANYPRSFLYRRLLWGLLQPLFRHSPRPLYGWRNALLRRMGARIGSEVRIYPSVRVFHPWLLEVGDVTTIGPDVYLYNLGEIRIGAHCLISHNAHLCAGTHDYTQVHLPLETPPIALGHGVWVCADVFVGPGVSVGDYAVLAARAVVLKDVAARTVVGGFPARKLKDR